MRNRVLWSGVLLLTFLPFSTHAADPADFVVPEISTGNEVIDTMFVESVDVAIDSIKTAADGRRYLSAGPRYTNPDRTYYRDSYWTAGLLLMIDPSVVKEQILRLAEGIEPDGSVPSALSIDAHGLKIPLWADHHDSGPFFVMMVYDYVRWTGDDSILNEYVRGRSVFVLIEDVMTHLASTDANGNLLPEKPANSLQDWLDTIPRGGEVLYNQVLYYRALRNMVELATIRGYQLHATVFHRHSLLVRHQINKQFWNEEKGYYFERCEAGTCVDRLTNESSLAILYDVIPASKRDRLFASLKKLEFSWGVVNAIPAYEGFKTQSYQNMTDWPVLDGMNAGARLKYGNPDWIFPMTQWWQTFASQRKEGQYLPEFVSPTDQTGGLNQAWSVNPVVSFIRYGIGLDPAIDGTYSIKSSPVGVTTLANVLVRGQRINLKSYPKK